MCSTARLETEPLQTAQPDEQDLEVGGRGWWRRLSCPLGGAGCSEAETSAVTLLGRVCSLHLLS